MYKILHVGINRGDRIAGGKVSFGVRLDRVCRAEIRCTICRAEIRCTICRAEIRCTIKAHIVRYSLQSRDKVYYKGQYRKVLSAEPR